ncbi:MAG: NAD(P)H-dependent oxidoreductase [Beijerinckiaceae bacterium]
MRILFVFCHPSPESFTAAVLATARQTVEGLGHETRTIDLYGEGFAPAMSREEWEGYHTPVTNEVPVAGHLAALRWAEAVFFVYPTWWYGQPAMLKGWLDRVLIPHGVFAMPEPGKPIRGLLKNITHIGALTTLGSPKWWWFTMGMPGRRVLLTGLRVLCHPRCKTLWIGLHQMDSVSDSRRRDHLKKIAFRVQRFIRPS